MLELVRLTESALLSVRKTKESPPRLSVFDVLSVILGRPSRGVVRRAYTCLRGCYPDVVAGCEIFKFSGHRYSPVATAYQISQILQVLPGKAEAGLRGEACRLVFSFCKKRSFVDPKGDGGRSSSKRRRLQSNPDGEVCLQEIALQHGLLPSGASALGKLAKQLYLEKHPGFVFAYREAWCNGRPITVLDWRESMLPVIEEAIQRLKAC